MKLRWRGQWIDAPGYVVPPEGLLVEAEATVPLWRLEGASARPTRSPGRKVAVFLVTDGPRSTFRKARTKRQEPEFTGDLWVTAVLGRVVVGRYDPPDPNVPDRRDPDRGARILALAVRVPTSAQQFVVHPGLVCAVDDGFSPADLEAVANHVGQEQRALAPLTRQNYLYSGMRPPPALIERWNAAIAGRRARPSGREVLTPPRGDGRPADTLVRVRASLRSPNGARQPHGSVTGSKMAAAVLGAGDHARTEIIPALTAAGLSLHVVADRDPQIAAIVGGQFGFELATTDAERAIAELAPPGLVVVATAHDSHARLAAMAASAGHRVFLEKPPVVTREDVAELRAAMTAHPGRIEIGFNRRYHPLVRKARSRLALEEGPTSVVCTVKELSFEPDHWYFWANQGTRFTGNLCHWIDLAVFLMDGRPRPLTLTLSPRVAGATEDEERVLTVTFEDGSLLTVFGTTRGDDIRGVQEQIEIRRGRTTVMIDDLWKMRVRSGGIERPSRTLFRSKGHTEMYREALERSVRGEPATYPVEDMLTVSAIQIAASELASGDDRGGPVPDWSVGGPTVTTAAPVRSAS